MFRLFGSADSKQVASELVAQLTKYLPPDLVKERLSKLSVNRVTHQIEALYSMAEELRDQHRLGFIGKTIMANEFQWELKQLHYPDDFVDMVVEGLVLRLQKTKSRKTK